MKIYSVPILIFAIGFVHGPAFAGGQSENAPWQAEATNEKANRGYLEDMRMKRTSGFYSSPVYNTTIGAQYNCNVTATASGNGGSNSASANSAQAIGPTGTATGNQTSSNVNPATSGSRTVLNSGQDNYGQVNNTTTGNAGSSASNNTSSQVLNTNQQNSGAQYATVDGANACAFAGMAAASR
ncbi:hypothetical protein [Novosphingobium sp. PASSN1]|uniref:hypothetical protein n=1 Tax=Novosphingobium sp. PASSN1 TaxID=2015561 RepID=UPI000BD715EF|nr:hypothetical protein [Novosphingobium sp. PASSN1]OYU34936.1 MAG: hypothetical protein CFE35_13740 [Novosphingobium sp. PASSN1]